MKQTRNYIRWHCWFHLWFLSYHWTSFRNVSSICKQRVVKSDGNLCRITVLYRFNHQIKRMVWENHVHFQCFAIQGLSYAPNVAYVRNPPKDFRAGAILSAIFCFFPLGFFAIYYSYRVSYYFMFWRTRHNAKTLCIHANNVSYWLKLKFPLPL